MITQEKIELLDNIDLEVAVEIYPAVPPRKDGTSLDLDEHVLLATVSRDDYVQYCDLLRDRADQAAGRSVAAREAADYLELHGAATINELLDRLDGPELKHFTALLAEALEESEMP